MRALPVPWTVAVLLAAACLLLATGCVPRPAGMATARPTSGAVSSASIGPIQTAQPGPLGPTPAPSFVRPTPGPGPTFLAYTVKSHDTLTSIAREFHTTPRSIAFWSRGDHPSLDPESATYQPDRLEVGWILRLIPDEVFDEDEVLDATPSPAASASPNVSPSRVPGATAG